MAARLMTAAPAMAKTFPDGGVTAKEVAEVMRAEGYKAEITKDGAGDAMILSGAEGSQFVVLFFGCVKERCTSYQMGAAFATTTKPGLEKANEWNTNFRFGKAYIDEDKDPAIEMDVDAEKGFTTEAISNNLVTWVSVLASFKKEFGL